MTSSNLIAKVSGILEPYFGTSEFDRAKNEIITEFSESIASLSKKANQALRGIAECSEVLNAIPVLEKVYSAQRDKAEAIRQRQEALAQQEAQALCNKADESFAPIIDENDVKAFVI